MELPASGPYLGCQPRDAAAVKKLSIIIPLGTLLLCFIGFLVERWRAPEEDRLDLAPSPNTALGSLVFAARDATLEGKVVALDGSPVPDALVWLRTNDEPHWAYTDRDGAFELDRLQPGQWECCVLAKGFVPLRRSLPDNVSFQLIPLDEKTGPPPGLPAIARSTIAGEIGTGRPSNLSGDLSGYEIVLTPKLPPQTFSAPLPRRALTDERGHFELTDLIEGEYGVEVRPPWARGGSWPDLSRPLAVKTPRLWSHAAGDEGRGLSIELKRGTIHGILTDDAGEVLRGALVLVTPAGDPERIFPPLSTDEAGAFSAGDLPEGSYLVTVRAGAARVEQTVVVRAGATSESRFTQMRAAHQR